MSKLKYCEDEPSDNDDDGYCSVFDNNDDDDNSEENGLRKKKSEVMVNNWATRPWLKVTRKEAERTDVRTYRRGQTQLRTVGGPCHCN